MMAKPRGATKTKDNEPSPFLKALRFVALAQREIGEPYQTHVILSGNTAVAYDGTLAAGALIDEALEACPHTELLIKALARTNGAVAITQTSQDKLTIKTDNEKFTAHVPCLPRNIMPTISPDPAVAPISNEFVKGLEKIAGVATENGTHIITASILVRRYSMVATDRAVMLEYWHGIDLPTFALPKAAAIALLKCGKELQWFGFSQTSVTFYFTDNTWLRSQLYDGQWPDVDAILNLTANAWPVPPNFFEGVRAVAPFNENGWITFRKNKLASQREEGAGAEYAVAGVPQGPVFNAKYLLMLETLAKTADFVALPGKAAFYGDNLRGVMIGVIDRPSAAPEPVKAPEPPAYTPENPPLCGSFHKAVWGPGMYAGKWQSEPSWQWPQCDHNCIPF